MPLSRSSVLHYWSARYGPLPIIGGDPVHTRNSASSWADGQGIVQSAIVNTPAFDHATIGGERRPTLSLSRAVTNICLQSAACGVTWTVSGTPTRSAAALTLGGVTLDFLGDDSAAALEYFVQALTFSGNGAKALSIF